MGLVMMSMVYTDIYYFVALLIKPIITVFAWFNVRFVYKNSLRTFYSKNLAFI